MSAELMILFAQFSERIGTIVKLWNQGSLDPGVAMKEITDSWLALNKSCDEIANRRDRTA